MADDVRITNFPTPGSHEAVALEIWKVLRDYQATPEEQLYFYAKCRRATYGTFEFKPLPKD